MTTIIPKAHSPLVRNFFFWTGIVATFSYRLIIVMANYPAVWLKTTWYVGTIGFVIYFIHRYQISERRAKLIHDQQLYTKVATLPQLDESDKAAMEYVFRTLESSKEKWNYIFIFVMSGLALLWGIITDLGAWFR